MNRDGLQWVSGHKTPQKVYITRVLNFGTWAEWQRLQKKYSTADILQALQNPLKGQWTRHGKAFAEKIFGISMPADCLITYGPAGH